jgi:RNA polymerase sigma-70 factor (ECF subfamily)
VPSLETREFAEEHRSDAARLQADDARLLQGLRDRDEAAFTELVERHHAAMIRVARRLVGGDVGIAEEVAQEAWVAVLRGIDRFEGRSSLRTWIFSIVTHLALQRRNRDRRREVPFSSFAQHESDGNSPAVAAGEFVRFWPRGRREMWKEAPQDWELSPEDVLVRAELREAVMAAIAVLPEAQQTVITLRDVLGFTSDEICDSLGITANNQRVLLHRARARVRTALVPEIRTQKSRTVDRPSP